MAVDQQSGRVVVVGAGLAAVRLAQELRALDFAGSIVLLGAEPHRPYDRPPLSKEVLRGTRPPTELLSEQQQADLRIELHTGTTARALDLSRKVVHSSAGEHPYDVVVIASGARPRRLAGTPGLTLRTIDDAEALRSRLTPGARLVVIGAGLIGCEVAASARGLGAEVDVVDVLPQPMIRVLGSRLAPRMTALHEEHGVRFHLGVGLAAVREDSVVLTDGTVLPQDVVLESIGVIPDVEWLRNSGLELDEGVVADPSGQAAPGVWTIGDVAQWRATDGVARRTEHWTAAADRAAHVAAAITGAPRPALPAAYWWSDQYDVKIQGHGELNPEDDLLALSDPATGRGVALASRDGRLTAAITFRAPAIAARMGRALKEQLALDEVVAGLPEAYVPSA